MDDNSMIKIIMTDEPPESMMMNTAVSTIKSILGRLNEEYCHRLPKEVCVSALNDTLTANKELIPLMIPEYMIDWLIDLWDSEEIFINEEARNYLEYLKIFGFAVYVSENRKKKIEKHILINQNRKEDFYFYLRSRSVRDEIRNYTRSEKIITGYMFYYGFIETKILYEQFLRASRQLVSYDDFARFIKCRCSLWAFGEILKDIHKNVDYFSWCEAENREMLLLFIREHKDIPYKEVNYDDLTYISDGGGIDNRWPGISELGTLLVNDLDMDYYRTTVQIHKLIRMVHNGNSLQNMLDLGNSLPLTTEKLKKEYEKAVHLLYNHVPVFEYKGYSRHEYHKLFYEKQLKKKTSLFTVLDGGKDPH